MAQKSMPVQTAWRRWLIGIGTPEGVMANVGDRRVMGCCDVWLIGPLIQGIRIVASGRQYTLHLDSIEVCTIIRCLPIVLSDRVECGTDWCCSAVSLKRPVCGAGRKLTHRSRRI
jgi:hypothetical protein